MHEKDQNRGGSVSRRDFLLTGGFFPLIGPASALAVESALARSASASREAEKRPQTPPDVQISQAVCGAYLRDDFNSGRIDPALGRIFVYDPGFRGDL